MRTATPIAAALALLALLAPTRHAEADALAPPPRDCPAGSYGTSSRRGEHCEWAPCPGECPATHEREQLVCSGAELALCVQTIEHAAAEVQQGPRLVSLPAETWHVVRGPCAADGSCASGQRCERRRACVAPGSAAASSLGCSVGAARRAPAWLGLALGVVLALRRRGLLSR